MLNTQILNTQILYIIYFNLGYAIKYKIEKYDMIANNIDNNQQGKIVLFL